MGCSSSKPVSTPPEPISPHSTSTEAQHESSEALSRGVKSKRESAECRAFRKCFADLADGITDPGWLAVRLYSKELIGRNLHKQAVHKERVKTEMLLSAVEDQIIVDPATKFREFLDVLQSEPSLQHLATRLEGTHRELISIPPSKPTPSSSPIDTYASYLKSVYTREKLPIYDKWPLVKSKKFINLALIEKEDITKQEVNWLKRATIHGNIDDIKESKRATDMSQIAQLPDGSQPKCILVDGAPGVGKSTFAWELCHEWGKGMLLQQYQLVVLLRLRDKSVRAAKNISDLFHYHDNQIQKAAVEEIQRMRGKGVLLLFEGYDELPDELRTESSVFLGIITGRELPEATVLVTSRPWASEFLHIECKSRISQQIEILGFTKANIFFYIASATPNDPSLREGLKKYISCYPHIGSLMYIPLNAAIVVEVYRNSREDETLVVPKTMTELYSSLVRSLLLRYLVDHPVHSKKRWSVHSFNDLPQDVYEQLCELGRIAYEGILHGQQVIFSDRDLPEDFKTLGFMQCVPELYVDKGAALSYNFLHLTVQEYLAAFHLSHQPVEKQVEYYRKFKEVKREPYEHKQWDNHFHMVLLFLSGLRNFNGYSNEILNALCIDIEKSGDDSGDDIHEVIIDILHLLFEAQDKDVIAKLLGPADVQLHVRPFPGATKPSDYFVLGYCVSHSNCTWRINLTFCYSGDEGEGLEMFVQGISVEETDCTGGISEMSVNLIHDDYTSNSEGMKHLLSLPKQLINKMKVLNLDHNGLDSESYAALARFISRMPDLKRLDLNADVDGEVHSFLLDEVLGVEDCEALSRLLSSLISTSLKEFNISDFSLPPEAVEQVISGLHHANTTLEKFCMYYPHFTLQITNLLASALRTNHTLVGLELACFNSGIDSCQLATALCTNDTLQKLQLINNPIGIRGADAFAEMLRTNHTLVNLQLEECNIYPDGACQLASALCKNDTLQEFSMSGRSGFKGAAAFAEMLLKNKSLKVLKFPYDDDSIGEEGTQKLIDSLEHNTTLETLKLSGKYKSSIAGSVDSRVRF